MPKKYYKIELGNNAEIHVYFETLNGIIVNFVVKLILMQDGGYREIIRFDSAHGCPHKDVIDEDGHVIRKVWFEFIDNNDGLNLAVKDLKDNFDIYIERYLKWQKK
jgi:hypothetical protein